MIFSTKSADCIWGSTVLYVFHKNDTCVCIFFLGGKGGGGTPLRHGHKESYKDLKNLTSKWDSNRQPH